MNLIRLPLALTLRASRGTLVFATKFPSSNSSFPSVPVPSCSLHSTTWTLTSTKKVTEFESCQSYLHHIFQNVSPEDTDWNKICMDVVGTIPAFPHTRVNSLSNKMLAKNRHSKPVAPSGLDSFIYTACNSLNNLPQSLSFYQYSRAQGSKLSTFNLLTLMKGIGKAPIHDVDNADQAILEELIREAEGFKAPARSLQTQFQVAVYLARSKMRDWRQIYELPEFWTLRQTDLEHDVKVSVKNMVERALAEDELEAYAELYRSPEGKVLNTAIFEAYDRMYDEISYLLGQAVAQQMQSEEL